MFLGIMHRPAVPKLPQIHGVHAGFCVSFGCQLRPAVGPAVHGGRDASGVPLPRMGPADARRRGQQRCGQRRLELRDERRLDELVARCADRGTAFEGAGRGETNTDPWGEAQLHWGNTDRWVGPRDLTRRIDTKSKIPYGSTYLLRYGDWRLFM